MFAKKPVDWYRRNSTVVKEITLLFLLGLFVSIFLYKYDVAEGFYHFSRAHEDWELDELLFVLAIVCPICLTCFAMLRWRSAVSLMKRANTDFLTGVLNHRKGWDIIEEEIFRSTRYARPLSLILFDLDNFKGINDFYGHLTGDRVLKAVASAAQKIMRDTDHLIRWGGEEFILVCPETDESGARQLAERIRQDLLSIDDPHLPKISASFGVRQMLRGDNLFTLVKGADQRMYQAKQQGKNVVV